MNDVGRSASEHAHDHCSVAVWSDFCAVAASPDLKARLKNELAEAKRKSGSPLAEVFGIARGLASKKEAPAAAAAPWLGPGTAGVALSGRF